MATVHEICRVLEELAPTGLAEPWDNVGLLLGRRGLRVFRLMTCLTLTERVASEAIREGVQLVVTHHPIFFRATRRLTDETAEGRLVMALSEAGIAVYSPHTAFDSASRGINQILAEALGLQEIHSLRGRTDGQAEGSGRRGRLAVGMSGDEFLGLVASVVGAKWLQVSMTGPRQIERVGIACGAAGDFLDDARRAGCDTFVTGEARFHTAIESEANGMNLVLMGHYASERPTIVALASRLRAIVPGVECLASLEDRDPFEVRKY